MERNITIRRTQSLKSFSDLDDKPIWTDIGLRDRTTSVSDLVARYQASVKGSTITETTPVNHLKAKKAAAVQETKASPQKTPLKSILKKTQDKTQANLKPAKSMENLQSTPVSIMSLKALYEAKAGTPEQETSGLRAANASPRMRDAAVMNGEAKMLPKNNKSLKTAQNASKTETKLEQVAKKAVNLSRAERRKTIGGTDFERNVAALADEKKRAAEDVRDSGSILTEDALPVSVKVMSALYLSKVATQESTNTPLKPEHNQTVDSVKRGRSFKFQPVSQEMCSGCLKPVYQMEKIAADKYTFHKNCFSCKKCKKKLSVSNYTPVNGEFYCIFHYQQLFKRKGNYDEGFGHAQHKSRWLLRRSSSQDEVFDE